MKISHGTIEKKMIHKLGTEKGMAIRIDTALLIGISGPS